MSMAEWVLTLVMPREQASATVGDLVEARAVVWLAALRIAGATVLRQWTSAPMQVVRSPGYGMLLVLRFAFTYVVLLSLAGRFQRWWNANAMATFTLVIVALVIAEYSMSFSLRKHSASEPGVSLFANVTRLSVLLVQLAWHSTLDLGIKNLKYSFGVVMIVGVLLPIQVGRLVARNAPGRELSSGLAITLFWGAIWIVRFAWDPTLAFVVSHPDPLLLPMELIGIASARRGMAQEASWQR